MTQRQRRAPAVVFADVDGVLGVDQPKQSPLLSAVERLRPERIARLNRIVANTRARVVVSSTWRCCGLDNLRRWFRASGAAFEPVDVTPRLSEERSSWEIEHTRGTEILAWIAAQPVEPRAVVVLDDMALRGPVERYLVRCDERFGLTDADVERAVKMLRRRSTLRVPRP